MSDSTPPSRALRSQAWFDNPANVDMTALYLERYLNYGLSVEELRSGKPIIGIAQTGSDLSPCNRHHLVLAERVRDGIREAGGIPIEFPVHPIQETGKRPTAGLEHYHFKHPQFGRPGLLHGHFFGTATLSFSQEIAPQPGDVFEIAADAFHLPLRSPLARGAERGTRKVTPL